MLQQFSEIEPDFQFDYPRVLRKFVKLYIVDFNAKIFHLYSEIIDFRQELVVQYIDLREEVNHNQYACEVNRNNDYSHHFFMESYFRKWNFNIVVFAAKNTNVNLTRNQEVPWVTHSHLAIVRNQTE
jgi:spore coat polysaccharide biosynthesis protein SpsF (cytidylyltransferase family)